ncbi:hypothetical protein llap_18418 [Limosa lapponica baueri]|uniref:Alpha/beta hydrolase fold-3 domain-containing protein n=1 Tax=Limosa lapponica baueri TaxID=1758121 RepID=A0A2I0TBV9_LIMLA|nr:hypothetical protein llap_18418 [Limosa lapponica baueri]
MVRQNFKVKVRRIKFRYRLAPEHKYPAAYEDCLNATIHFMNNVEYYGVDPARIITCGDSAGGNLAAAVSQTLAGRSDLPKLRAQILIYPGLQALDFNLPSYQQNRGVPLLFRERAAFFALQYLNGDALHMQEVLEGSHIPPDMRLKYRKWVSPDNIPEKFKVRGVKPLRPTDFIAEVYETVKRFCEPNLCPLLAEDAVVHQLPESFILTCEYDVLRDDGLLYKKRLEDNEPPTNYGLFEYLRKNWHEEEAGVMNSVYTVSYELPLISSWATCQLREPAKIHYLPPSQGHLQTVHRILGYEGGQKYLQAIGYC